MTLEPTGTFVKNVDVSPDNCGTPGNQYFCVLIGGLSNDVQYGFVVKARNNVGYSAGATKFLITPLLKRIREADRRHGWCSDPEHRQLGLPSSSDPFVGVQSFNNLTTGVGLLLEKPAGSFCGGPCISNAVLANKLKDPTLSGQYIIELLYYKTQIKGTGTKVRSLLPERHGPPRALSVLPICPKNPANSQDPCSVIKLMSAGANPQLRILIYTRYPTRPLEAKS